MLQTSRFLIVLALVSVGGNVRADDEQLLRLRSRHLTLLGVEKWHEKGMRGQGVRVAILDSGFRGYRQYLGTALPKTVLTQSFRLDRDLEAKDSQHGILCAEVVHAIAPDAELILANWEPDTPESFLRAVKWAKDQHAQVLSCSVVMPGWSDGRGGGPVHQKLSRIVGDDLLCCASAGNIAQRHWAGTFRDIGNGWHGWSGLRRDNRLTPWDRSPVSVELTCLPGSEYDLVVIEERSGGTVGEVGTLPGGGVSVRFRPEETKQYSVRLRLVKGPPSAVRMVVLGAGVEFSTMTGSISFPADGNAMLAVGAVNYEGRRSGYSSCGPGAVCLKPDFVAPVPFPSIWRLQPFAGTSAAAPQAAGIAALWVGAHPDWTPLEIANAMRKSCRDLITPGHDIETGFGQLSVPAKP